LKSSAELKNIRGNKKKKENARRDSKKKDLIGSLEIEKSFLNRKKGS